MSDGAPVRDLYADDSPAPTCLCTGDAEIGYANRAAADLFDAEDPDALTGRSLSTVASDRHRERLTGHVERVVAERETVTSVEVELTSVAGEPRHAVVAANPTEFEGVEAAQVVFTDVTEYVRTHETLTRRNEQLNRFTGVVSHDLRNPLNVLAGRLATARDRAETVDGPGAAALRRDLDRMVETTESMETLVADLLTLARQGDAVDSPEPVWLPTVARSAWRDVESEQATLTVDVNRSVPGDERRLRELLENLFANAVRHGGADVEIRLVDLRDGEGFAVADDGVGFGEADPTELFDHGFTTAEDGTGFGLAIVERIAEAHGWSLRATESRAGGARFEVRVETE